MQEQMELEQEGGAAASPFLCFTVMGPPRGKGRPRFSNAGQFVRVYTDKKTRDYEDELKAAAAEAMDGRDFIDEAVSVSIRAYMPIPASWSKAKKEQAERCDIMPTTKPRSAMVCWP